MSIFRWRIFGIWVLGHFDIGAHACHSSGILSVRWVLIPFLSSSRCLFSTLFFCLSYPSPSHKTTLWISSHSHLLFPLPSLLPLLPSPASLALSFYSTTKSCDQLSWLHFQHHILADVHRQSYCSVAWYPLLWYVCLRGESGDKASKEMRVEERVQKGGRQREDISRMVALFFFFISFRFVSSCLSLQAFSCHPHFQLLLTLPSHTCILQVTALSRSSRFFAFFTILLSKKLFLFVLKISSRNFILLLSSCLAPLSSLVCFVYCFLSSFQFFSLSCFVVFCFTGRLASVFVVGASFGEMVVPFMIANLIEKVRVSKKKEEEGDRSVVEMVALLHIKLLLHENQNE